MGKQSTRNPRKFESHGNYQPYGIPKISKDHKHLQQHKFKAIQWYLWRLLYLTYVQLKNQLAFHQYAYKYVRTF